MISERSRGCSAGGNRGPNSTAVASLRGGATLRARAGIGGWGAAQGMAGPVAVRTVAPWWWVHGDGLAESLCVGEGDAEGGGGEAVCGMVSESESASMSGAAAAVEGGVVAAPDLGFALWVHVLRCVPLRSLDKCCRVSREWRRAARESLGGRTSLDFSGTIAGDGVIRAAVMMATTSAALPPSSSCSFTPGLVHLDLWGTRPSALGLLALARDSRFARLESLSLWGTCLGPRLGVKKERGGAEGERGFRQGAEDEGLDAGLADVLGRILEDLPRGLRALNLGGTSAGDACLALLHGSKSADLESLLLSGTRVTDEGVLAWVKAVDARCTLKQLSLWGCRDIVGKAEASLYARWPSLSLIGGQV